MGYGTQEIWSRGEVVCNKTLSRHCRGLSNVECSGPLTFLDQCLSTNVSSYADTNRLRHGRDRIEGRAHLWEYFVEPLQRTVEMNLYPTRRAGHVLAMVLRSPTFHKTHPNCAHLGQLEDGTVAVVHRLQSRPQSSMFTHSWTYVQKESHIWSAIFLLLAKSCRWEYHRVCDT